MRGFGLVLWLLLATAPAGPLFANEAPIDPATGLVRAGDWELVRNNCVACHSPRLITQQRGTKDQWRKMIRWMQESQNLWQFAPDVEAKILTYLAENYPPSDRQRRTALPSALMPPNPYAND